MAFPILPIIIAFTYGYPSNVNLHAQSQNVASCMKANPTMILIADSHAGEDPHDPNGDDPHGSGSDPDNENHDYRLKSNSEQFAHQAPQDPYGGAIPNGRMADPNAPYPTVPSP